jgi:hypothetical protein
MVTQTNGSDNTTVSASVIAWAQTSTLYQQFDDVSVAGPNLTRTIDTQISDANAPEPSTVVNLVTFVGYEGATT